MDKPMDEKQLAAFRSVMNRSLTVLAPDRLPGDSLSISEDQLRLIAGVLGTEGTAREVETYVRLELEKWRTDPVRGRFLTELLAVVLREIDTFEFYRDPDEPREHALPSEVTVVNLDDRSADRKIPIDEFLNNLRSISASSVFKR